MTQRKPDRFERVARKAIIHLGHENEDIAKLLRQEHEWMRRMVTALPKAKGYAEDLVRRQDLLNKLTQRRK